MDSLETEFKLDVPADFVMPNFGRSGSIRVVSLSTLELDATYFDAPTLTLLSAGITVRRRSGDETRWTVKLPARLAVNDGALTRREIDLFSDALDPPVEVVDLVRQSLAGERLVAVARLHSHRQRLSFFAANGDPLGELDDDQVTAHAPDGAVVTFREVEFELENAADGSLVDKVLTDLYAAGAMPSGGLAKIDRALGLLGIR